MANFSKGCLIYIKKLFKPSVVIQAFNSSTGESEAEGSGVVQGQPGKHSITLSQTKAFFF
jgi:hypothetical protein